MDKKPIKLSPAFKNYLWGGEKLKNIYGKNSSYETIAETWELSAHPNGESVVDSGKYQGESFSKYLENNKGCIGKNVSGEFPILIKFIDAHKNLSIQVHPDDEYAIKYENQFGKTECWYIIDCDKDSYIYYGLKEGITKKDFEEAIEKNEILNCLNKIYTKPGETYTINPGTLHAIGSGNLICEIQQNSDITYRVFDYNRKDKDGNYRELHQDKALDVINFDAKNPSKNQGFLINTKYFNTELINCNELKIKLYDSSFTSLIIIDGKGEIELNGYTLNFNAGDSIFVPAQNNKLKIKGKCKILKTTL